MVAPASGKNTTYVWIIGETLAPRSHLRWFNSQDLSAHHGRLLLPSVTICRSLALCLIRRSVHSDTVVRQDTAAHRR